MVSFAFPPWLVIPNIFSCVCFLQSLLCPLQRDVHPGPLLIFKKTDLGLEAGERGCPTFVWDSLQELTKDGAEQEGAEQ